MRQGEIYWADAGAPSGVRPVVILTRTHIIARLNTVTIAPMTSTIRGINTEVVVHLREISRRPSAISLDNITTLEKSAIQEFIQRLDDDVIEDVFDAIHAAFDMPC